MADLFQNWAGCYSYTAARYYEPASVDALRGMVAKSEKVHALGSRHSFNSIADTPGDLISLARLPRIIEIDSARRTVTVDGGARYGDVCEKLHHAGLAFANLASLPHISVAGACATGTHGSGDRVPCLPAAVSSVELVTASGDLVTISRGDERFEGVPVNLGALGIVTRLTVDLVPAFLMRQQVYRNLPFDRAEAHFDAITSSAYSVSMFTDWQSGRFNQVWLKRRSGDSMEPLGFGTTAAAGPLHPIEANSAESCTDQMGAEGPWYERLTHFRMDQLPSSPSELQTEYFVPRRHAVAAIRAVEALREEIGRFLQISEVRTIAGDKLWMSPCYGRDSVSLHFTWIKDWTGVSALLPRLEAALEPFEARPHWGKLFTIPASRLRSLYPRLPDFVRLGQSFDPAGKFLNAFLDETALR